DKFPKHEIITTSDPVFANVRGFQRAGQQFADQIFKRG
ncbi:MAG: PRTRC system protein D, partial [Cyanobacteria bacterium PR.023]|nr:PRTRC system protein D [Cyanobacteria bacterium PR.023]